MEVIVETPKGSHQKFKFDEKKQQFIVNKTLPEGMDFPFNFGFVPQTKGEDGDPLDIIILSETAYATGTAVNVRIIGCLPARQTARGNTVRNDRFLSVPMDEINLADLTDIEHLTTEDISGIKSFFTKSAAAAGKKVIFLETIHGAEADSLLQLAKASIGS